MEGGNLPGDGQARAGAPGRSLCPAVQPGAAQQAVLWTTGGSGSSSYLSSFLTSFSTSFLTSWRTSWYWGSGSYWYRSSGMFGSFASSGSALLAGGYGLELI